jgi:hypothetical protein
VAVAAVAAVAVVATVVAAVAASKGLSTGSTSCPEPSPLDFRGEGLLHF